MREEATDDRAESTNVSLELDQRNASEDDRK